MTSTLTLLLIAAALGLVLGLLGGGGGILAVPLLVAAGQTFLVASSQSLVIVGAAAAAALVPHHRAGRVDWRVGLVFGALGAVGAAIGARLAPSINPSILLAGLLALLAVGAVLMLRSAARDRQRALAHLGPRVEMAGGASAPEIGHPSETEPTKPGRVVALASGVGVVTGLLGVGAGFVVVPALVSAMKVPVKKATATGLVVIVINSVVAATVRHSSLGPLNVAVGLAIASATAAVVGALLSRRVPGWILSTSFGVLMVLVGLYTGATALLGG